jgi:putative ABC transport system ATP-binding protein
MMRLVQDACKNDGMAAVVVTHDAQLASWADRVVLLRDGRVTDQTVSVRKASTVPEAGR